MKRKMIAAKQKNVIGRKSASGKGIAKSVLLCMLAAATVLAGCGKEKQGNASADSKNYVYSVEDVDFGVNADNNEYLSEVDIEGERMLASIYRYEESAIQPRNMMIGGANGATATAVVEEVVEEDAAADTAESSDTAAEATAETTEEATAESQVETGAEDGAVDGEIAEEVVNKSYVKYKQYDLSGNPVAEFEKEVPQNGGLNSAILDEQGNIYTVMNLYGAKQDADGNSIDTYTLQSYSETGDLNWELELGTDMEAGEWYYINRMLFTRENGIQILSSKGLELVNTDGTYNKCIDLGDRECSQMVPMKSGNVLLICYGPNGMEMYELDMAAGKVSSTQVEFPFSMYYYEFHQGVTTDFVLTDTNGVYTYNIGDAEPAKIMDFIDSDIVAGNISGITMLDDNRFFAMYYSQETGETTGAFFTKVAPENIKDKKTISLAGVWVDYGVREQIVKFNKENADYRIRIKDYSQYNTEDDYTAGAKKLNTDIASGDVPDILMVDSSFPLDSYANKGLFVDLYEYIDNDPELKREDYLANVFETYEKDGKLYELVPNFYVFTVFGKSADVGTTPGWTFADLKALQEKKGPDVQVFAETTASTVLNYSLMFGGSQLINWETGECKFDSQDFLDLLNFAKQFPIEIDYSAVTYDDEYWSSFETMYREGRALLMPTTIAGFSDYNTNEKGMFGEDITPIGFPNENKESGALSGNISFAISSKSKNTDGAWQFVRYYLTDEYQDSIEYGWPIKLSKINELAEEAQKRPTMTDENGNEVEYDNTYYLNGQDIIIPPMTQEETDEVISYITSIHKKYQYNEEIRLILEEECAPFFEGKKTDKEVADIIQSRVQIYVNENR